MIYEIFRWLGVIPGYPFKWLYFKTKIFYENENAPRRVKGGALIISNHFNALDYVLNVFIFFPRKLYVVASEYAFRNPLIKFGMKFWGGIEANRITGNMHFVSQSVKEIKKGHLVQIFPEGHNTDDGTIKPFYPSYLLIAYRANAPIVPVITDGNYGFRKKTHVIIGEPIHVADYRSPDTPVSEDLRRINDTVYQRILALRRELDTRIEAERNRRKKQ